jgi:polyisoprenyl-phosphate glycosyltransferase
MLEVHHSFYILIAMTTRPILSVVVPVYNEGSGIQTFHTNLIKELKPLVGDNYEVVYCNDGSSDDTLDKLSLIAQKNKKCIVIALSRNYGKELALAAGIAEAKGEAVVLIDGDGQHPISSLPVFYKAWQDGGQVIIGRRSLKDTESATKKLTSKLFYASYNILTGNKLDRSATDYRLLDREVVDAYLHFSESDRLNRFLIDWLGFDRRSVPITRDTRIAGDTKFTFTALARLALNTLVSSSSRPLHLFLALGACIALGSFILGISVGVEQVLLGDPLGWNFTGTALLGILLLFLVGILLIAQGVNSLYVAATYREAKQRPLYVINKRYSSNLHEEK